MTKEVRIGIIGCGKVAHFHAKAIANIPNAKLVAASNHTKKKLDNFCSLYKINGYLSIEEMIKNERLDAVTICTPHTTHKDIAVTCANLKCHLLIEKPLATTVDDCNCIIDACNKNGVLLGMLVQRRFYTPCQRIYQTIKAGKIGSPILGQVIMLGYRSKEYYESDPWRGTLAGEGGGVLLTQATHQIDLLNWYLGDIDSIYGLSSNYSHPYIEVEDSAVAVIKYKSGALATLLASNCQDPALYGKVHIFGSNGSSIGVQTDGGAMFIAGMSEIEEPPVTDMWNVVGDSTSLESLKEIDARDFSSVDKMIYYHQKAIENFVNSILGSESILADGYAGKAATEICHAVYQITKNPSLVWKSCEH